MDSAEVLKRFLRVAELGSFTQAADSLGLPKASISQAIQNLESKLHTQLFHRTTRSVRLTPDGQVFYEKSREVLIELEELESLFISDDRAVSGVIRVNMSQPMARQVVIPQLADFLQQHPHLTVDISSDDRKVDLITEGYDCVIRTGHLAESGLIVRSIGEMQQYNFASPAYLARFGEPQTLSALKDHFLIHYHTSGSGRLDVFEYMHQGKLASIKMPGRLSVNNTDAYRAACVAGLGIMQAPRLGVQTLLNSGQLVEILQAWRAPALPVSILFPQRRNLSRRVRVFMDWLGPLIAQHL